VRAVTCCSSARFRALPRLLRTLTVTQEEQFGLLVARATQPKPDLTSREERRLRRTLQAELDAAGVMNAAKVADTLVDFGIYGDVTPLLAVLQSEQADALLHAAAQLTNQHHSSTNILTAVERMSKIIFALKTYAHADATGQPTSARITDGLELVLTLYHNHLQQGIEVVTHYADVPALVCYPDELHQVWTHLIHNAIQAMQGKGRLDIAVRLTPVETHGRASLLVEITDSGPGIPPEIQGRIFEPFFTTKPAGEGSGLGLDICRKIVDKHQGKIEFESQPGKTTFRVWLPLETALIPSIR